MDTASPRPFLPAGDEAFANRIMHHITPLLAILFNRTNRVMKGISLPYPRFLGVTFGKSILPKGVPPFNSKPRIPQRAKEVRMIWH